MVRKLVDVALGMIPRITSCLHVTAWGVQFLVEALQVEVDLSSGWRGSGLRPLRRGDHLHVSDVQVLSLQLEGLLHVQELTHYSSVGGLWLLRLGFLLRGAVLVLLRGAQVMLRVGRLLLP